MTTDLFSVLTIIAILGILAVCAGIVAMTLMGLPEWIIRRVKK